jgi:uncharacterized protein YlbG (UPF0298 family)
VNEISFADFRKIIYRSFLKQPIPTEKHETLEDLLEKLKAYNYVHDVTTSQMSIKRNLVKVPPATKESLRHFFFNPPVFDGKSPTYHSQDAFQGSRWRLIANLIKDN